ncbi:hypothetical protein P4O66_004366 [Electrophorus voltai]|uniref:Uncharacterized protein n=1 Tax=Electrophorus voltai TaxID=2609070 RepID=A0AAD8ZMC7_9TELE|nr:hypothetical protein P4O66_004366 [Electrophorus voltai]
MLGKGAQCARALSLFLTLARFPRGLFLELRPLVSLRISIGHLGSGVRDGLREKGCGDIRYSEKSEKSEEDSKKSEKSARCGQSSRDGSRPHRRHLLCLKLNPSKTELLFIPDTPNPYHDLTVSFENSLVSPSEAAYSSFVTYKGFDPFFHRKLPRMQQYDWSSIFRSSHVTPLLCSLHWLPVAAHIRFKTLMLAYKAKNGPAPSYMRSKPDAYLEYFKPQVRLGLKYLASVSSAVVSVHLDTETRNQTSDQKDVERLGFTVLVFIFLQSMRTVVRAVRWSRRGLWLAWRGPEFFRFLGLTRRTGRVRPKPQKGSSSGALLEQPVKGGPLGEVACLEMGRRRNASRGAYWNALREARTLPFFLLLRGLPGWWFLTCLVKIVSVWRLISQGHVIHLAHKASEESQAAAQSQKAYVSERDSAGVVVVGGLNSHLSSNTKTKGWEETGEKQAKKDKRTVLVWKGPTVRGVCFGHWFSLKVEERLVLEEVKSEISEIDCGHLQVPQDCGHPFVPQDYGNPLVPQDCGHSLVPQDCDNPLVPQDCGHSLVPQDCGHSLVPQDCGHSLVPQDCGHSLLPQDCGHSLVPQDCGHSLLPQDCGHPFVPQDYGNPLVPQDCGHSLVPQDCDNPLVPQDCGHSLVPQDCGHSLDSGHPLVLQDCGHPLVPQDCGHSQDSGVTLWSLRTVVTHKTLWTPNCGHPLVPQDSGHPLVPQDCGHPLVPEDCGHPLNPQECGHPLGSQDYGHPLVFSFSSAATDKPDGAAY